MSTNGPEIRRAELEIAEEIYALRNNTLRKLLFDRLGALLGVHHVDIE